MVILIVYVSKTHTCVGNVMKIFFFKLLWKTESGFVWVVEPFPAPMENWTSVGGFEVSNSLCFDTILFNHSVSLVLQAMFLQLTLKSECGLLFLMEVLEGLSLTHLTGVQRKPWAGNTSAVTRVIYLVSPASNFSPVPRGNHCFVRANQDVDICFFSHLILFGKVLPGWLRGCEHLWQMNLMLRYAFWEK